MYSSKGGTQCKRVHKKGEDVRPYDMLGPGEEMEKNQKILLWLMEGQKEMVQHKRSPYGLVIPLYECFCAWSKILLLVLLESIPRPLQQVCFFVLSLFM